MKNEGKKMSISKTIQSIAIVAFLALTGSASAQAAPFGCIKHKHSGTSKSVTKSTAKILARQKWRIAVIKDLHDPSRALWRHSKGRSSKCNKRWGIWKCKVRAYPCRKIIGG